MDDEIATEVLAAGRVVARNFRIEKLLGEGAMGQVYLAEQLSLGKKVAIKVLHRHLARDPALAKRFHREARSASQLNHPNSIQIIDFGQDEEGALFIAMELLDGRDLGKLIRTDFPLPLARTVRIMSQVCAALDEAHVHGVIHRDLKPENIMVMDRRGEPDLVKVCDFGIAKIQDPKSDAPESIVTMAGLVCGTPEYMSPEQARGEKLDGRTDLYSAGVILYQIATGELPFTAGSALGVVTKHLTEMPIPPRQRRPDVDIPPALQELILRAMEKERVRRPDSALALKRELEELLALPAAAPDAARLSGRVTVPSRPATLAIAPTLAAPSRPGDTPEDTIGATPHRRRGLLLGAVAAIILVGAVLGAVLLGGLPRGSPSAPLGGSAPPRRPAVAVLDAAAAAPAAPVAQPARPPDAAAPVAHPVAAPAAPVAVAKAPEPDRPRRPKEPPRPDKRAAAEPKAKPEAKAAAEPKAKPEAPGPRGFREIFADAEAALKQGQVRDAVKHLEEARRLSPNAPRVHRLLGKSYNLIGRYDEAVRSYRRCAELAPTGPDADICRASSSQ